MYMHSTYKYILSTYWFVSGTYQNILGTYLVHTLSARPLTMSFISTPILRISKYENLLKEMGNYHFFPNFFSKLFQKLEISNFLEKFGKVWKSLETFGKRFSQFFQFRNWKHLLFYCHSIEYYISSTCRNPGTEERSQHNVHTERTSCHFPKK